jgi:hypothetical protein
VGSSLYCWRSQGWDCTQTGRAQACGDVEEEETLDEWQVRVLPVLVRIRGSEDMGMLGQGVLVNRPNGLYVQNRNCCGLVGYGALVRAGVTQNEEVRAWVTTTWRLSGVDMD